MGKIDSYKKERKKYLNGIDYVKRKMKRHIILLSLMALAVIVYSVYCTIDMKMQDARSTEMYVKEYTEQIADQIDMEVDGGMKTVHCLSEENELKKDEDTILKFLDHKREIFGFDFAVYKNAETEQIITSGTIMNKKQEVIALKNTEVFREVLEKGFCAVGIKNGTILYAQNIYTDGEKVGTLWVGYQEERFKDIFEAKVFQEENSTSYIINNHGDILLTSDEKSRNLNLAVLLGNDEDTRSDILKMRDNIAEGKNGIFRFLTGDHQDYYLAYAVTEIDEWTAVTLIPADLFTGFSDSYVGKMLGCLVVALVVFGALFTLLFKGYSENSRKIEKIALCDDVTGGINRIEFQMRYQELCRRKKAEAYTLVLMDCMDFKMINDSLGAKNGDRMLEYFYAVINSCLYPEKDEFAARIEMDHFFLCLKEKNPDIISRRMDRIVEEINSFKNTDLTECSISFWMGACAIENNETDLVVLQDQARAVVKNLSRQEAGTLIFFDNNLAEKIQREREMERGFDESLLNGDFCVYFQPKVDFRKEKVAGAEALVRWNLPERGMVSPAEFIPLLESNGKICMLDRYVFDFVCKSIKKWKAEGRDLFPISVNLSRCHFVHDNFLSDFIRISEKYQIDRRLIEFEITENIFLDVSQIRKVKEGLHMIHQYGFRCSLDDFGVGYSSLTLLRELDIDVLKLDRSFFSDLDNRKARNVITSIVQMSEGLGITIVAEGIETKNQICYLDTIKCSTVQGYFFSRPLPVCEFEKWVESFIISDYM